MFQRANCDEMLRELGRISACEVRNDAVVRVRYEVQNWPLYYCVRR